MQVNNNFKKMAADTRGHDSQVNTSTSQQSLSLSYASAVRPRNDQAIVLESIPDCTNDDYLDGLEKLLDISEILCISKISGSRVIVFLSKNSLVETLKNQTVQIKNNLLRIRPYVESNKRVVISNISPVIPNEVIIEALKPLHIIPVSQINYIRAGLHKPGRSHILSYRRQMYIKQEDENKIPDSIQINYDSVNYWIYFSTESTCCFVCKQSGHIAKTCPKVSEIPRLSQISTAEVPMNIKELSNCPITTEINTSAGNVVPKRPPPSSTTSEASAGTIRLDSNIKDKYLMCDMAENTSRNESRNTEFKKPVSKKRRTNKSTVQNENITDDKINNLEKQLLLIKEEIDNAASKYNLSFNDFQEFLKKSWGQYDITDVATGITSEWNNLVNLMDDVYSISDKSLKARFTRLKKKLLQQSDSEIDSDSSLISIT